MYEKHLAAIRAKILPLADIGLQTGGFAKSNAGLTPFAKGLSSDKESTPTF
jgi:hypothetical protein